MRGNMTKKILFTIFAVLVIVAVSWNIAYSGNLFFHMDKKILQRNEPIITYETYNLCTDWTDTEEPECLKWMAPKPMRVKSRVDNWIYYEAYVIAGQEFKKLPVVGKWNGLDIIHVSSSDMSLKADPAYIGDSYSGMAAISEDLHDGVHVTEYEIEEDVEGVPKIVRKRIKTKKWKEKGRPPVKIRERIPHVYFGVDVE